MSQANLPTDQDLKTYAARLPTIYRDILAAFPGIEPGRKAGYGLAFPTLATHFYNRQMSYGVDEVEAACLRLGDDGFLDIKNGIFAHPTELGERLIGVIVNRPPAEKYVLPELPARTW